MLDMKPAAGCLQTMKLRQLVVQCLGVEHRVMIY